MCRAITDQICKQKKQDSYWFSNPFECLELVANQIQPADRSCNVLPTKLPCPIKINFASLCSSNSLFL